MVCCARAMCGAGETGRCGYTVLFPIAPNQNNNVFAQLVLTREETQIEGPFFSWFLYPEFTFKIDVCTDGWVYRLMV